MIHYNDLKHYPVPSYTGNDTEPRTWSRMLENTIQSSEMKSLRGVKGCTRVYRLGDQAIRYELNMFSTNERIKEIKQKRKDRTKGMCDERHLTSL